MTEIVNFHEKLAAWRKTKGFSLSEASAAIGRKTALPITPQRLGELESGAEPRPAERLTMEYFMASGANTIEAAITELVRPQFGGV